MACLHINNLQIPPKKVLILSDSRSVLQALARGGSKNRLGSQLAILELIHSILNKNIDLSLMWVPSHSGIRGNDIADSVAKSATVNGISQNIGFSNKENMSKARQCISKSHDVYLRNKCQEKGWYFAPGLYKQLCKLPRTHQRIVNRIVTFATRYKFFPSHCSCKKPASFQHLILDNCSGLPHFQSLRAMRQQHQLHCEDFLIPHSDLGYIPIRKFVSAVLASDIASWF